MADRRDRRYEPGETGPCISPRWGVSYRGTLYRLGIYLVALLPLFLLPSIAYAQSSSDNTVLPGTLWVSTPNGATPQQIRELVTRLNSSDMGERLRAIDALGKISPPASGAVPALTRELNDSDPTVRSSALIALGRISQRERFLIETLLRRGDRGVPYRPMAIHLQQLREARTAIDALPTTAGADPAYSGNRTSARTSLDRIIEILQREKEFHDQVRFIVWTLRQPVVAGTLLYLLLVGGGTVLLLTFRPMTLLALADTLDKQYAVTLPGGIQISSAQLLGVGFVHYHPSVLDAWVARYTASVRESLRKEQERRLAGVSFDLAVTWNGDEKRQLLPAELIAALQPVFDRPRATVLIQGEAGSGKSTLACWLAAAALSPVPTARLCATHPMLPVLVREECADAAAFLAHLQRHVGEIAGAANAPSPELMLQLLRERRLLVIVDGLSELPETQALLTRSNTLPLNALIVTSRTAEPLPGLSDSTISIPSLSLPQVTRFATEYLTALGKFGPGQPIQNAGLLRELARFYDTVGAEQGITVQQLRGYLEGAYP